MSGRLVREDFVAAKHIPQFQWFDCGSEGWDTEVANWIKAGNAADSVVTDMASRGTRVWVYYREEDNALVGFGSLGKHKWTLPGSGTKQPISIIPNLAVALQFRGVPPGTTYAMQIMDDLFDEAENDKATHPVLALCVDARNQRAIHFYMSKYNFTIIEPPLADGHLRMAVRL